MPPLPPAKLSSLFTKGSGPLQRPYLLKPAEFHEVVGIVVVQVKKAKEEASSGSCSSAMAKAALSEMQSEKKATVVKNARERAAEFLARKKQRSCVLLG